ARSEGAGGHISIVRSKRWWREETGRRRRSASARPLGAWRRLCFLRSCRQNSPEKTISRLTHSGGGLGRVEQVDRVGVARPSRPSTRLRLTPSEGGCYPLASPTP